MKGQIRILLVEDNEADAELMARALREAGYHVVWTRADTEEEFLRALEPPPEVVLADYHLPRFSGLRALDLLKERHPDVPCIIVSGTIGEEKAAEAIRLGADDYVLKDRMARLPTAVRNAVRTAREHTVHRKAQSELDALRERLKSILTALPDAVWSIAIPSLEVLYISPAASTVFGHEPREFYEDRNKWLSLLHPDDRARMAAAWQNPEPREYQSEYRIVKPSGEVRWIQGRGRFVADASGKVVRADGISRDVTEIVRLNERIRRLNRLYAVLSGINAAIVRIRDRQELFDEACRVAVEAGRFVMAWIGIVDNQAALVRPVASHGDNVRGFLAAAPLAVLENKPGGHGLAGQAVRVRGAVLSNDVKNDPQRMMRKELEEHGINSLAILPLIVSEEVIGVIALYAADVGFFDEQEMRLLGELAGDISYAVDHIEKSERLNYIYYYDPVTGLANRTLFHERLKLQLEDAARERQAVALQILDIDRFKAINDTLGRQAGDALLTELAKRMKQGAHPSGWFARLGADDFAIVMPNLTSGEDLARRTEKRYDEIFSAPFDIGGTALRVAARIGIALFPADGADADTLLRNAEAALKRAKETGERYLFYTQEMTARVSEKLALENKLRQGLENDEFVLHYQPKVELETRRIVGMEALIRWQSPELGLVPPAQFVPLLEETGLILEVGAWALKRAARDRQAWVEAGFNPPRVSVNVSAIQLRQRDFVRTVERVIGGDGATPGIDLEITESLVMEEIQANIEKLAELRRLGVGIAIDDFGTGYSSLAYLARLPVETLKIDRSFIAAMAQDPTTMTLVQTVIQLAHSLRLKVVAEGVETEEQANILRLLRCDQMQGYLISRPLPSGELAALLGRR